MKRYILTLAPEDGEGTTATAHIDVNGDGPRLKQVTFSAADGGYLPQMPFDIEGFIAGVMPRPAPASPQPVAGAVPELGTADEPSGAADAETASRRTKRAAGTVGPAKTAKKTTSAPPRAGSDTTVRRTTARAKSTTATKAPKKATAAAKESVTAADTKKERVYNKMPDDFAAVYAQASTVAGIADYYRVPTHTAQGWVKTARRRNLIPQARTRAGR